MKFWYNPNFLAIAALIILCIPALKSLSTPGFYTSHDGETHTARIAQYYLALKDGQIPPRIAPTLYNGLGSPIFTYIYPIPYLFGSFVHSLGISYVSSFKILMAAGFVLSQIFAYFWLLQTENSEKAAFLGALFYGWVPYRFLLIYVRGSISELLAYTFLPLVFLTLTKLSKSNGLFWMGASAISTSLVLLSQNLVAVISLPIVAGYILITALTKKSLSYFVKSTIAGIWGLLISSFVYLPSIFERKFVRFDEIVKIAYPVHFVTLKQLIHSPWGYGFDMPGTANDQLSFQIGLAQILVFIIAFCLISLISLKIFHKYLSNPSGRTFGVNPSPLSSREFTLRLVEVKSKDLNQFRVNSARSFLLAIFFTITFLLSVFLMMDTKPNIYIWQHLKILHTIDIPWRFLGVASLSLAYLAAFVAKTLKPGIIFLLLTAFVIVANRNHIRINESLERADQFFETYGGTATQYNEFTPITRQTTSPPAIVEPSKKIHILDGSANLTNLEQNSKNINFDADVKSQTAQVRIDKFYFPNVKSNIGHVYSSDTTTKKLDLEKDGSGLTVIDLPSGFHQVSIKYQETDLRLLADYLTLTSLLLAAIVLVKNAKAA